MTKKRVILAGATTIYVLASEVNQPEGSIYTRLEYAQERMAQIKEKKILKEDRNGRPL